MTELTLAGLSSSTLAVITLPGIAVTNAHCWATYFPDARGPGSVFNIIIFNSGSRRAAVGLKERGVADKPLWVQIPHLTLGKLCSVFLLETKGAKCSYLKGGSDKLHTVCAKKYFPAQHPGARRSHQPAFFSVVLQRDAQQPVLHGSLVHLVLPYALFTPVTPGVALAPALFLIGGEGLQ